MAMTAAQLIAARTALQTAIYSGQLQVRYSDGRSIMYQSTEAMLEALRSLDAEYATATAATSSGGTTTYASHKRG